MWLNDLFWGIRNTFVGKLSLLIIDHLWGPSVHVDKSFKKIQEGVRPPPPSRQCLHFGKEWYGSPSLSDMSMPLSLDYWSWFWQISLKPALTNLVFDQNLKPVFSRASIPVIDILGGEFLNCHFRLKALKEFGKMSTYAHILLGVNCFRFENNKVVVGLGDELNPKLKTTV